MAVKKKTVKKKSNAQKAAPAKKAVKAALSPSTKGVSNGISKKGVIKAAFGPGTKGVSNVVPKEGVIKAALSPSTKGVSGIITKSSVKKAKKSATVATAGKGAKKKSNSLVEKPRRKTGSATASFSPGSKGPIITDEKKANTRSTKKK